MLAEVHLGSMDVTKLETNNKNKKRNEDHSSPFTRPNAF